MKKFIALMVAVTVFLCSSHPNVSLAEGETTEAFVPQSADNMFTDRDKRIDYDESKSVLIQLNGDSIACDSNSVQISGTTAIILEEGIYILSGTLNNGMIVVNADHSDKVQLVLNNARINSATSAPLYILEADKVFLTLAENTDNALSNGGTFSAVDENHIDAVIFSKQDLTLNGTGYLTITSPAGHGIVSKDDLVLTGGSFDITAASHGLQANDSVRITGATLSITAGRDGIHAKNEDDETLGFVFIADGTLNVTAEGDGISASGSLQIENGSFNIVSGNGSSSVAQRSSTSRGGSMGKSRGGFSNSGTATTQTASDSSSGKGLKAGSYLLLNGGSFSLDAADDAIHTNGSLSINGGSYTIRTGDDGIHADNTLTINDGTIDIVQSYEGIEALELNIAGGNISLVATDDGLNAAGGTDSSGFGGWGGNDTFGRGGKGGHGGSSSSSNGMLTISGGNIYISASGDGIDANGSLLMTGGYVVVCGPTQGDTSVLDYDRSGTITGGTFIGTGARNMSQSFSNSEQGVIAVTTGSQAASTPVTLKDSSGNTLIACTPALGYEIVILSSPELVKGQTYTLIVGNSSAEMTAN